METACNLVLFERWEVDTSQFFVIGNDCSITEEAWIRKKDFKSPAALSPRFRTEVLTTYLREQTRTGSRYGDYRSTDEVKWEAEIGLSLLNPVTPSRAFHLYRACPYGLHDCFRQWTSGSGLYLARICCLLEPTWTLNVPMRKVGDPCSWKFHYKLDSVSLLDQSVIVFLLI